jgi:aminomethyltransferase
MVEFAGWDLPVQYAGVIEEHRSVRSSAGLFDVSHMGELSVSGSGAEELLQAATPNNVSGLNPGRAQYSALLTDRGTYIDDLLIYRLAQEEFLLVVNAANTVKDLEHLQELAKSGVRAGVKVEDLSQTYALLALQGPRASEILRPLTTCSLEQIQYYGFERGEVAGQEGIISRTGYTGEDGFELYVDPNGVADLWDRLLRVGEAHGLQPAGLGARDTLRLEAGMALYGHEIDENTTPWEARLGWTVKLSKGPFVGSEALAAQKREGVKRKLVGFEILERGIARQGHRVWVDGKPVGEVTSGTWSPTFEKALGLAYVPTEHAVQGAELKVEVRNRRLAATVVDIPFYRRSV